MGGITITERTVLETQISQCWIEGPPRRLADRRGVVLVALNVGIYHGDNTGQNSGMAPRMLIARSYLIPVSD